MSIIITIDGPSASGKGTLARNLAKHLDYFYLDTGAMYRLIALETIANNLTPEKNEDEIALIANNIAHNFTPDMLNNPELRKDAVGEMASRCSALPSIRYGLEDLQKSLAHNPPNDKAGAVLDGRDCGTFTCPDADYKFFITASTDVRAKRRYDELKQKDPDISYATILEDMKIRDKRDTEREYRPLKPADDAILINTDDDTIDTVLAKVLSHLK